MQRPETIDFWNKHHAQDDNQEWILVPSDELLDSLSGLLLKRDSTGTCSLLEIGCGTSHLARDLFLRPRKDNSFFIVTDVSPVCIASNQARDAAFLATTSNATFDYQVLDALQHPSSLHQRFDIILDKGCLDTFLFRGNTNHDEELMTALLDNVHSWLASSSASKYVVLSPRKVISFLREYQGFESVVRKEINQGLGVLQRNRECVYMHVCTKRDSYRPRIDAPFLEATGTPANCEHCGMAWTDFYDCDRKKEMTDKAKKKLARRWTGHVRHCRTNQKDSTS